MAGLIAKKIGMTRIFDDEGVAFPVTVLEAGPCPVVQVKTEKTDGYRAVQLGFGSRKVKRATKAEAGHAAKAGLEATPYVLREFAVAEGEDLPRARGALAGIRETRLHDRPSAPQDPLPHGDDPPVEDLDLTHHRLPHRARPPAVLVPAREVREQVVSGAEAQLQEQFRAPRSHAVEELERRALPRCRGWRDAGALPLVHASALE